MLMFFNGFIVGIGAVILITASAIKGVDCAMKKEEFVRKLVKEKGWVEAGWELQIAFGGKYMRTWRRLYKKHIEGK